MQGPSGPSVLEHVRGAHGAARGTGDATLRWLASRLTGLQSITAVAARGAAAQMSPLSALLWSVQQRQESAGHTEHLQWVPAHCVLPGNEQADALTKEATGLIQQDMHRSTPAPSLVPPRGERRGAGWPSVRKAGTALSWQYSEPPRRCGAPPERRRGTSISSECEPLGDARNSIITASVDVPPISANSAVTPAARRFGVWSAGSLLTHQRTSYWSVHTFWACASVRSSTSLPRRATPAKATWWRTRPPA